MSTRAKGARATAAPIFIRSAELAGHLGCTTSTIHRWVAAGVLPPPHSRLAERTAVWLRRHFDAYVATGAWPREAFKMRAGG